LLEGYLPLEVQALIPNDAAKSLSPTPLAPSKVRNFDVSSDGLTGGMFGAVAVGQAPSLASEHRVSGFRAPRSRGFDCGDRDSGFGFHEFARTASFCLHQAISHVMNLVIMVMLSLMLAHVSPCMHAHAHA